MKTPFLFEELIMFTFYYWLQISEVNCLRDVTISMPNGVEIDAKVRMICQYNLEGETLYTLKWFKGDREFFRYTPKETPNTKFFAIDTYPDLDIVKEESYGDQVTIRRATRNLAGQYTCEVTTDIPSLHADSAQSELKVAVLPSREALPIIKGYKPKVKENEVVELTCISPKSIPAANLTWIINNMPITALIKHNKLPEFSKRVVGGNDLEESTSNFSFLVKDVVGNDNNLKVRCTASIFSISHLSSEISLLLDKSQKAIFSPETRAIPYYINSEITPYNIRRSRPEKHNIDSVIKADNAVDDGKAKSATTRTSIYVMLVAVIARPLI